MRSRRARLVRAAFALVNLIAALVSLGAGAVLLLLRERQPPPRVRAVELPDAFSMGQEPVSLPFKAADRLPVFARTTAYEDFAVLADAPLDFATHYRVIFVSLDDEPAARKCIVHRNGAEQLMLSPGERMGSWLLLAIDPEPRAPRSVRLRFRDLRRGEEVTAVLSPDP